MEAFTSRLAAACIGLNAKRGMLFGEELVSSTGWSILLSICQQGGSIARDALASEFLDQPLVFERWMKLLQCRNLIYQLSHGAAQVDPTTADPATADDAAGHAFGRASAQTSIPRPVPAGDSVHAGDGIAPCLEPLVVEPHKSGLPHVTVHLDEQCAHKLATHLAEMRQVFAHALDGVS